MQCTYLSKVKLLQNGEHVCYLASGAQVVGESTVCNTLFRVDAYHESAFSRCCLWETVISNFWGLGGDHRGGPEVEMWSERWEGLICSRLTMGCRTGDGRETAGRMGGPVCFRVTRAVGGKRRE